MKQKRTFADKCLAASMIVFIALLPFVATGCNSTEVVQDTVNVLNQVQGYVGTARALLPELQTLNPVLAQQVDEYTALASGNVANLITVGNAYLSSPSGDKYQNILNGIDALTATVDAKVLAVAKVTNPASQAKVLAVLTVISVSLHAILTTLKAKASKTQMKSMSAISARVSLDQIKPYLDLDYAREKIAESGRSPEVVLWAAGL